MGAQYLVILPAIFGGGGSRPPSLSKEFLLSVALLWHYVCSES